MSYAGTITEDWWEEAAKPVPAQDWFRHAFWANFRQYRVKMRAMTESERSRFAWCMRQGILAPLAFVLTEPSVMQKLLEDHPIEAMRDHASSPILALGRTEAQIVADEHRIAAGKAILPDLNDIPFVRLQESCRRVRIAPE